MFVKVVGSLGNKGECQVGKEGRNDFEWRQLYQHRKDLIIYSP